MYKYYLCTCGKAWFRSAVDKRYFIHNLNICSISPKNRILEEDLIKLLRKPKIIKVI